MQKNVTPAPVLPLLARAKALEAAGEEPLGAAYLDRVLAHADQDRCDGFTAAWGRE